MAHVLIVEDDPRIRPLLMRSLGDMGYAVASASTGMAGLTMVGLGRARDERDGGYGD